MIFVFFMKNTPTGFSIGRARAGVIAIAAGDCHSLVVKSDGTVWSAGRNGYGQLGDGTKTYSNTFVKAIGISGQ